MRVILAEPRGFCAGVDRAIAIVDRALEKFGPPIYVRHEIVHNRTVVERLKRHGARFVDGLDQVPDGAVVVFSAHGVAQSIQEEAARRPLRVLDATCPLVAKVHREAQRLNRCDTRVILIGHKGHAEVTGTLGQLPPGRMTLVSNRDEADRLRPNSSRPDQKTAYITQTTLSVDDAEEIAHVLRRRLPGIEGPLQEDICYATQNRQNAVKHLAGPSRCDLILVIGAPNSSNSNRLREVAEKAGCPARLIESVLDVDPAWLENVARLGVTAGASAPEMLVEKLLTHWSDRIDHVETVTVSTEMLSFSLPKILLKRSNGENVTP